MSCWQVGASTLCLRESPTTMLHHFSQCCCVSQASRLRPLAARRSRHLLYNSYADQSHPPGARALQTSLSEDHYFASLKAQILPAPPWVHLETEAPLLSGVSEKKYMSYFHTREINKKHYKRFGLLDEKINLIY